MRFYLFDGKAALGPYDAEELSSLPGFGAESIVCPVGSQKAGDWKPAGTHSQLKALLFKPRSQQSPSSRPQSDPCAKCMHGNPRDAVFCNRCGDRLSGFEPKRAVPTLFPTSAPPAPTPWATYAASIGAVLLTFMVFFVWLKPKNNPAPPQDAPVAATPKIEAPAAQPPPVQPDPPLQAPPRLQTAPRPQAASRAQAAPTPTRKKPRRKSKRKRSRPAPIASAASQPAPTETNELDALLETSIPEEPKAKPQQAPVANVPKTISLPGFSASQPVLRPASTAASSPRAPGFADSMGKLSLKNAREQFDFCHNLMNQQAFGDVFDSCLSNASRQAAPFRGHKETYVRISEEAAASEAGKERPSFEITEAKLTDSATALITARSGEGDETTETWLLEDGLWRLKQ